MILLLGGTTEATPIAKALVDEGYEVLLSTATSMASRNALPTQVKHRCGMLDAKGLVALIREWKIRALIDATHPYAASVSTNAWSACRKTEISYIAYDRPCSVEDAPDISWANTHEQAAVIASSFGRPILLTLGTRYLLHYVQLARQHDIELTARVLDHPSSLEYCQHAGLKPDEIVAAKGPFSVADNTALIVRRGIGVVVTKDSGEVGGAPEKITAARETGCHVVVVRRPARPQAAVRSIPALLLSLRSIQTLAPQYSHDT